MPRKQTRFVKTENGYTIYKRAKHLVASGRAEWTSGTSIRVLPLGELIRQRGMEAEERAIRERGVVYWNGPDKRPWAMRKPGEVRS